MINVKLITNIFKVLCLIGLIMLVMNSCQDSTLPNEPELRLLSQEQVTINPGELPEPMIVVVIQLTQRVLIVNMILWFHYKQMVGLVDTFVEVH